MNMPSSTEILLATVENMRSALHHFDEDNSGLTSNVIEFTFPYSFVNYLNTQEVKDKVKQLFEDCVQYIFAYKLYRVILKIDSIIINTAFMELLDILIEYNFMDRFKFCIEIDTLDDVFIKLPKDMKVLFNKYPTLHFTLYTSIYSDLIKRYDILFPRFKNYIKDIDRYDYIITNWNDYLKNTTPGLTKKYVDNLVLYTTEYNFRYSIIKNIETINTESNLIDYITFSDYELTNKSSLYNSMK